MVKKVTSRDKVKKVARLVKYHPPKSFNEYQPISQPSLTDDTAVIVGDLHACVPSFVQRLIEKNIIRLSGNDYERLVEINNSSYIEQMNQAYQDWQYCEVESKNTMFTPVQQQFCALFAQQKKSIYDETKAIVKKERADLRRICEQIEVIDTDTLVKLLGDELCDRNVCDYDMLYLIFILLKKGVKLQSTLSNHALEFLMAALKKDWALDAEMFMLQGSYRSFTALKLLLIHGIITQAELQPMIKAWQDSLRVVFCSLHNVGATSYGHAPIGKETYQAFAKLFNIPFEDKTPELLDETLMKINAGFKLSLIISSTHPDYFIKVMEKEYAIYSNLKKGAPIPRNLPYIRSTWNRNLADIVRPTLQELGYVWDHVCGHEMFEEMNSPKTTSLDNVWGKPLETKAIYSFSDINPGVSEVLAAINNLSYYPLGDKADNFIGYSGVSCFGHIPTVEGYVPLPMHIFKGMIIAPPNASQEAIRTLIYEDIQSQIINVSLQMNTINSEYKPEINYMTTNEIFPGSPGLIKNITTKKRVLSEVAANDSRIHSTQPNKKSKNVQTQRPITLFFGPGKENQANEPLITAPLVSEYRSI